MTIGVGYKVSFVVILEECVDKLKVDSRYYNSELRILAFAKNIVYYPVQGK